MFKKEEKKKFTPLFLPLSFLALLPHWPSSLPFLLHGPLVQLAAFFSSPLPLGPKPRSAFLLRRTAAAQQGAGLARRTPARAPLSSTFPLTARPNRQSSSPARLCLGLHRRCRPCLRRPRLIRCRARHTASTPIKLRVPCTSIYAAVLA